MICIVRFNEKIELNEFKKAHEELELEWKNFKQNGLSEKAYILKAIINGATSLELLRLGRLEASKKAWKILNKYWHNLEVLTENDKTLAENAKKLLDQKRKFLLNKLTFDQKFHSNSSDIF